MRRWIRGVENFRPSAGHSTSAAVDRAALPQGSSAGASGALALHWGPEAALRLKPDLAAAKKGLRKVEKNLAGKAAASSAASFPEAAPLRWARAAFREPFVEPREVVLDRGERHEEFRATKARCCDVGRFASH